MSSKVILLLLLLKVSLSHQNCEHSSINQLSGERTEYNIRFPNVHTSMHDQYMCTGMKIPNADIEKFITSFEPHAKASKAHHMLVYGCHDEVADNKIWKCKMGSVCPGKSKTLYAWARNAKALKLPKNVGFGIGDNFKIRSFVMQIHYKNAMKPKETDCSGITMVATRKPQKYYAGIYLIGSSDIYVPPHGKGYGIGSCVNDVNAKLNVFAFRTHAHGLGKVVTAYRVRDGKSKMIGKGDPLWPEAFYKRVGDVITLQRGDKLMARCDYVSSRDVATFCGFTGKDEMCNFYMMYYTKNKKVSMNDHTCWNDNLHLKFPPTASNMCPYPGYAGLDSKEAILSKKVVKPKVPKPMQMDVSSDVEIYDEVY